MLDNATANASYYGYPQLPSFSENAQVDVLYIYNDIFNMHEQDMYKEVKERNINEGNILKIYFDYEYPRGDGAVIFKKYLSQKGSY
jgi:hypothetical protein